MPVIREYQPQTSAPAPMNKPAYTAEMFGAAEGRALENAGAAVMTVADTVAKRMDQENTSDVTAKLTKANADLAIDLQDTIRKAEPGDKKVFEEYNKRVEETIGKIGEEASTVSARNFYGEASERIKGQLYKTAADGQAELAGVKGVNDYTSARNNLSAAAVADPSSVGLQRELHAQAINNLVNTGLLPRSKAMELHKQGDAAIVSSSVMGWIQLNPKYAKEKLKSGEYDSVLGAEGKLKLLGEVDQAERAAEIDAERRRIQQERVVKQRQQQTQNQFLQSMVDGNLSTKDILNSNLDAFGSGSKEQFLQMLKANNEREIKTDPSVMVDLFRRINLPDGDPDKIIDENELNKAVINRQLSFTDLNRLRDEFQGKNTAAGSIEGDMKKQVMDIAKGKLTKSNPLTGFRDPIGDEQMARFMVYFHEEYKTQRAAGVPAAELLSPDSPKYLGKHIANYQRTNQQIMRDLVPRRTSPTQNGLAAPSIFAPQTEGANAGTFKAPPPKPKLQRMPDEKPADFLKRKKAAEAGGG